LRLNYGALGGKLSLRITCLSETLRTHQATRDFRLLHFKTRANSY
jgi:hypothetical protein